ncbi:flagellar biosynthesis protein FlhF [Fredinandcohnia sp. 179-A 10B2 NHS]|uniref:flagellar biosynthesis protein FlhF n=1 Tax=Fredinandcohnia sp. 179-A 10B2 NHS TaxID=3235176 RepID=UPI0039A3F581
MKVKKYIASSMPEAMKLIRAELGSDAVILNSKVVQKSGFLGLFRKKNFEVIAAVDPVQPTKQKLQQKEKIKKLPIEPFKEQTKIPVESAPTIRPETQNSQELIKEIRELKTLMKDMSSETMPYSGPLAEINQLLIAQELDPLIRKDILSSLLEKWYLNQAKATYNDLIKWTNEIIISYLSPLSFGGVSYQKRFINVVGPTGVGKTTTLAKIAADCMLKDKKRVAFITTDTYRIAAIDQLKTYAKILGAPLEVCYSLEDFTRAKEKYMDYDVVLVDTAGRNFRNKKYVDDLNSIINFSEDMETYLVLSLTSKMTDMADIYKQFSVVNVSKMIFTKVDETINYGPMLNLMIHNKIGAAYVTNGQNVPDDIVVATPSLIANTLLGVDEV